MNVGTSYGGTGRGVRPIPGDGDRSSDSELSDDNGQELLPCRAPSALAEESSKSKDDSRDKAPPSTSTSRGKKGPVKCTPKWTNTCLERDPKEIEFTGSAVTPSTIKDLNTALQFFKFLCPVEVFKMIREESLRYSIQCRPEKPLTLSVEELERFVGMALYMSIIQLPSTRDYSSSSIGHHKVADVMCLNRWEELKRFLHFNNNETFVAPAEIGHNKLHKVRTLLNKLLEQLKIIPREEKLCIDEQIVPFKGRSSLKQYNPTKPHRWGHKVFALSGVSGFCYDFEVFSGAAENKQLPGKKVPRLPCLSSSLLWQKDSAGQGSYMKEARRETQY
ncbi:piggyBac transposable element-derived protein 4-like [Dermacentor albipictus]|uniref:piggyBac transposable element-derived protein 4-like n=1 Tax=Dermacentor albipictus TaxID=60249 RepID=UPI0038FCB66D